MRGRHGTAALDQRRGEIEITDAAIGTYRRLLTVIGGRVNTYPAGDGGLICEHVVNRARPTMWRISADGAVIPDSRYSFARGGFIRNPLPRGV